MSRRLRLLQVALVGCAVIAAGTLLGITCYQFATADDWGGRISSFWETSWIGFSVVGGMLMARRPDEPIGRFLTLIGFFTALTFICAGYANHDYRPDHQLGVLGTIAGLAFSPAFAASFVCIIATVLTFPSGRLDTRLRRFGGRLLGVSLVAVALGYLLRRRQQLHEGAWVRNPLHAHWLGGAPDAAIVVGVLGLLFAAGIALVCAVLRFRRSTGVERQQMRWFARSTLVLPSFFFVGMPLGALGNEGTSNWVVFAGLVLGLNAIAIAIGVAILRYRLYDVDRIVSRTVSYAVVTGVIVGVYVGAVVIANAFFGLLGVSSSAAVAASTLFAAAVFQPIRRRVQHVVDRRFDRASYDARQTVESFSNRLRDEVDVNSVRADLAATVALAVAPREISVWLVAG